MTNPDNPATHARALRLLLATIDADEARADQALDEDDMSPWMRAIVKQNAIEIAVSWEAQHGRDATRNRLQNALLRIQEEEWEHRDAVGYTWLAAKFDGAESNEE